MEIEVTYYGEARAARGLRSETICLRAGSTVKEFIDVIASQNKTLSELMLRDDEPYDYLTYFVGGANIHSLRGYETELREGDAVVIAPTIVGG